MKRYAYPTVIPAVIFLAALLVASCADPSVFTGSAYIYGVTDYSTIVDLSYTDDDAEEMAGLFEAAGYDVYLRLNDGTGSDGPATTDQLQADIDDFIATADGSELFVFYFSGHGGRYEDVYEEYGHLYDLPEPDSGAEPSGGDEADEWIFFYGSVPSLAYTDWEECALTDDDLAAMLAVIPGNMKLVIIDACNSGGFLGDGLYIDSIPQDYSEDDTSSGSIVEGTFSAYFGFSEESAADIALGNAYVFTAAGELELSIESSSIAHGYFTQSFLEAASSGDTNGDGFITLYEIYENVCLLMDDWNDTLAVGNQYHPHITGSALDLVLFDVN